MLEETGTVVKAENGFIWVETTARSACASCSSSGGCGTSTVAELFGVKRNRLRLDNTLGVGPGQQVVIGIPDQVLTAVSLRAYLLPLGSMLGFAALAAWFHMDEGLQGVMAVGGLFIGLGLLGWSSNNAKTRTRYAPQLLRLAGGLGVAIDTTALTRKRS